MPKRKAETESNTTQASQAETHVTQSEEQHHGEQHCDSFASVESSQRIEKRSDSDCIENSVTSPTIVSQPLASQSSSPSVGLNTEQKPTRRKDDEGGGGQER